MRDTRWWRVEGRSIESSICHIGVRSMSWSLNMRFVVACTPSTTFVHRFFTFDSVNGFSMEAITTSEENADRASDSSSTQNRSTSGVTS